MVEDLSKKVVLITGCSSGIGLMTAVEMARSGFRVFASMRNLNKREDLDSAAKEAKVLLDVIELDVTKKDSIHSAIKVIENKAGPIDILVNNAGYSFLGFAEDVELNDLKQIFNTNFFGLVEMTQAIVPKMRERHTGHIINISSTLGIIGVAAFSAYCASKFAIEGYMESLRYEGLLDGYYVSNIDRAFSALRFFLMLKNSSNLTLLIVKKRHGSLNIWNKKPATLHHRRVWLNLL